MGMATTTDVTLRFYEIRDLARWLVAEAQEPGQAEERKRAAVERLGIAVQPGDSASQAWLRAMCEENGFAYALPVPEALSAAIREHRPAFRFYFWLT